MASVHWDIEQTIEGPRTREIEGQLEQLARAAKGQPTSFTPEFYVRVRESLLQLAAHVDILERRIAALEQGQGAG